MLNLLSMLSLTQGKFKSKGVLCMSIDLYQKSSELLEKLANSIYDRDPGNPNPFFFNVAEVHLVENWLTEMIKEIEK
jgi:hypothetical protein